MTSKLLFYNIFILRTPRVSIFADIIKIVAMFIKTIWVDFLGVCFGVGEGGR